MLFTVKTCLTLLCYAPFFVLVSVGDIYDGKKTIAWFSTILVALSFLTYKTTKSKLIYAFNTGILAHLIFWVLSSINTLTESSILDRLMIGTAAATFLILGSAPWCLIPMTLIFIIEILNIPEKLCKFLESK